MRHYWSEKDIELLRNLYPTEPVQSIANLIGVSCRSVQMKAQKLNIRKIVRKPIYKNERYWNKEEIEYLLEHYPISNTQEIVKRLGQRHSLASIYTKARSLGLQKIGRPGYKKSDHHPCYCHYINERFFDDLTDSSAYVIGLIFADGCLERKGRVSIHSTDPAILYMVKEIMETSSLVRQHKQNARCKPIYSLRIDNIAIYNKLLEFGLSPRKSFGPSITFCNIPDDLFFSFLRGFFDGDGMAKFDRGGLVLNFGSASRTFLENVAYKVSQLSAIPLRPVRTYRKSGSFFVLYYYGKVALEIGRRMYQYASNLYISRKRSPFEEYASRHGLPF